jgi:hypothetical protein
MTEPSLIIEAFLDGDRVDADALKSALATDDGRDHLVQMLALREVLRPRESFPGRSTTTGVITAWRRLAVAAAIAVSVVGGYAVGHQTARAAAAPAIAGATDIAPTPSRVIEIKQWDRTNEGN